jgi:hypothetical protein
MNSRSTFENLVLSGEPHICARSRLKHSAFGEVEFSRKTNRQEMWLWYAHLTRRSVWLAAWKHLRGPDCKHTSIEEVYIFLSTTIHRIMLKTHQSIDAECNGSYALHSDFVRAERTSEYEPAASLSVASEMPCHSREGIDEKTASPPVLTSPSIPFLFFDD